MAYYIAPRFLDKLAVHITKNFLNLPGVQMPLILGVHGRKGEGKTFQCELVYERMGVEVVHISGGELESPDAGDPARLIRLRYREAAELVRVRGVMAVLMINDLDAGAGRFDAMTQYTVNTQLVNNTLMNIADNPTNVQLPGSYDETPIRRVPVIVTGNDFSTLYEPLIREGRMEKFYWEPDRDDRVGIVSGIFEPDNLSKRDIETLVDTFPGQAIDFYGALRSQIYDEQIRHFISEVGLENVSRRVVNSTNPPTFRKPDFSVPHLIEVGHRIVREQQRVQTMRLGDQYNRALREKSGQGAPTPAPPETPAQDPFYRAYQGPQNGHQQSAPAAAPAPNGAASAPACPIDNGSTATNGRLKSETVDQVKQLLNQGYRVGLEHVDQRRFRTNAWQTCASIQTQDIREATATLEQCLASFPNEYVRIIGINPKSKQRILEQIIQRP
ncbi:MAG: ribulose bisphosphate carboxylase small subunit [Cyanobacteria bacterium Co-bin13]|nr:ribulose bisphosphate carboxylase small subunit [Cyanobacteria bacterium Co-bin13]